MIKGVEGYNLEAYLLALEGWRRGLSLTWYYDPSIVTDFKVVGSNSLGTVFSLSSDNKTYYFQRSRGSKVSNQAVDIVKDKHIIKKDLINAGVSVPDGERFNKYSSDEDLIGYAKSIGFPLVIKPTFGSLGKGLYVNVKDQDDLKSSLIQIRDLGYDDIIVERFFNGEDLRVYVVDDQAVAATKRVPANVVGNGVNTIEELIEIKNEHRKQNPYLTTHLIHIDNDLLQYLNQNKLSLTSIPTKGEKVYLRKMSHISLGGDPIDVTDEINPRLKSLAINAVKAIPGLTHGGVDILFNRNDAIVIKINSTAEIGMHLFPVKGTSRNIPKEIIDFYFPKTKGLSIDRTNLYFDYQVINNYIHRAVIQEFQVTDVPTGKLYTKQYVVSGKVQKTGYRRWIRREARKRGLHGYAQNLRNGKVVVVVGGKNKNVIDDFKDICQQGSLRSRVDSIKEYAWDSSIKVGFELKKNNPIKKVKLNKEVQNRTKTVSLTAVGDILLHGRVYGGLRKKSDFNFDEQLSNVKELLGQTDITIGNLESIVAGRELGLSSFPRFNAPVEIAYTLRDMGVDIVSIANNHTLDKGEEGILKSIENLEKVGLEYVGAYKSFEDRDRLRVVEKSGLKICFLSYTSGTNGIKIPKDKPYLVNSLRIISSIKICRLLRKIKRDQLADVIVVNLHFGREYHLYPTSAQKELARSLADAGADVIIGHHPHVLQPPEWIETSLGTKTFVAYSLGNFFSGQNGLYRQIGAALTLEVSKPSDEYRGVVITNPRYDLTFVNREKRLRYDIYLFREWIKTNQYIETIDGCFKSQKVYEDVKKRMTSNITNLDVE